MQKNTLIKEGVDSLQNNFIDNILSENVKLNENIIMSEREKTLLEMTCKNILIENIHNSDIDKTKKINTYKKIKEMNYNNTLKYYISLSEGEVIQLNEFGIRDFESKVKKAMKYGLAAIAGGAVGAAKGSGAIGVGISTILYFMFRKFTDPCWKGCVKAKGMTYNKSCQYKCKMDACKKIMSDLSSQINKCSQTPNQKSCEKKLKTNHEKWAKKLQEYSIKFRKHEITLKDKERSNK